MPEIVFLLYDSRSGSTLLSRLLNEYEDIGVTIESNFMVNLLKLKPWYDMTGDAVGLFNKLKHLDRFHHLKLDVQDFIIMVANGEKSINDFVNSILGIYFIKKKPNAKVWVIKDGYNGFYINKIFKEIPTAKFIHLIRDGRAVLNSRNKTMKIYGKPGETMARDPITVARFWTLLIDKIDKFSSRKPNSVYEVHYENLILDTDDELKKIRTFFGLKNEIKWQSTKNQDSIDDYFSKIPDPEKMIHGLVESKPEISRVNAWENELESEQKILFEYFAGNTLLKKGYGMADRIKLSELFLKSDLRNLLIRSFLLRVKSWGEYLINPPLLLKMIGKKLMISKN